MLLIPGTTLGWAVLTSQTLAPLEKSSSSFLRHRSPRGCSQGRWVAGGELPCSDDLQRDLEA